MTAIETVAGRPIASVRTHEPDLGGYQKMGENPAR